MPSKKPSTPRGTAFRQRVKQEGGEMWPATALDREDVRNAATIAAHIESDLSRAPSKADILRFSLECTANALRQLKKS